MTPIPADERREAIARDIIQAVRELPDCTNPEDWMMLVTGDELSRIINEALAKADAILASEPARGVLIAQFEVVGIALAEGEVAALYRNDQATAEMFKDALRTAGKLRQAILAPPSPGDPMPADHEALLPCPFCGEMPDVQPLDPATEGDAWTEIACRTEGCVCPTYQAYDDRDHYEMAARQWNRRAPTPPQPDNGEVVEEAGRWAALAYNSGWSHAKAGSRIIATDDGLIDGAEFAKQSAMAAMAALAKLEPSDGR